MRIILASGSPRRKELLEQIDISFEVIPSEIEESYSKTQPEEIAKELALLKALDIAQNQEGDCLVLGADTIVVQNGSILGKPVDEKDALTMLRKLQGETHEVYTGVAIIECRDGIDEEDGGVGFTFNITNHAVKTKVKVMPMTEEQIQAYIETGEPMDKAGAYGIQGKFAAYIEAIEGDYYNVVGLPLSYVNAVIQDIVSYK